LHLQFWGCEVGHVSVHTDGEPLIDARLIDKARYLHEAMGFSIIAYTLAWTSFAAASTPTQLNKPLHI